LDPSIGAEPFGIRTAGNIIDVTFSYRTPSEKPTPQQILSRFIERSFGRMRKLDPTRIVINLGLDSMENDPLGGLGFRPESYLDLIREIRKEFPKAKIGIILQGGYHWPNYDPCLKAAVYGAQVPLSDKRSAAEILETGLSA
jgi:acetoin utilization deacetylase AcuC-like enzyme